MRKRIQLAALLMLCACAATSAAHAQGRLYIKFHDATGKNAGYSISVSKLDWRREKTEYVGRVLPNRTDWQNVTNFVEDEKFFWQGRWYEREYWDRVLDRGPRTRYLLEMKHEKGATMFLAELDIYLLNGRAFRPTPSTIDSKAENWFGNDGSLYIEFFYPWAQDKAPWRDKVYNHHNPYQEEILPPVQAIAQISTTDPSATINKKRVAEVQKCCGSVIYEDRMLHELVWLTLR